MVRIAYIEFGFFIISRLHGHTQFFTPEQSIASATATIQDRTSRLQSLRSASIYQEDSESPGVQRIQEAAELLVLLPRF